VLSLSEFTPAEKVDHLTAYEITEWRKLRDAGVLAGKQAGARLGRPSKDQAELSRLRRQLALVEQRLSRTEAALEIMGKAHALLEDLSESAEAPKPGKH